MTYGYRRVRGLFVTPERLVIDIAHKDFMKLAHQRDIALRRQVLVSSDDDFVPASVRYQGRTIPVRIRLKGDLVDHLQGDKWSFRIVARRDSTILGMKQFSVQHPQTRDFLNEKMYHEVMRREDLVGLRYQFIDLTLNGKDLGVYALEESFETRLIENNQRKDGPIVRFDEDVLWGQLARQTSVPPQERGAVAGAESYLSSDIDAFQTSRWLADSVSRHDFLTAVQLLDGFRRGQLTVSQAFDARKLATFFALSDLLSAWHGVGNWPNARFYYNPLSSRLEPIAFDAYNRQMPARPGLLAVHAVDENRDPGSRRYISQFLADTAFYRLYIAELERVSRREYLDSLIADLDPVLEQSLLVLHREFPEIEAGWPAVRRAAEFIRIALRPPQALQAYLRASAPGSLVVDVANMQALPLQILGAAKDSSSWRTPALVLPGKGDRQVMDFQPLRVSLPAGIQWPDTTAAPLRIRFQVIGDSRVNEAEVHPWPYDGLAAGGGPQSLTRMPPNVGSFGFLSIDEEGRRIGIRPGTWRIDRDLIVPSGYRLVAGPGTHLDLVRGAAIVSRSPLQFRGEPDRPIRIGSSDRSGQGIAVLQAGEESVLEYVYVDGLTNLARADWTLTGAVDFYESPVRIAHSRFGGNRSEDALHVMRANFDLDEVTFENTSADALDVDFVKGSITNSVFVNCGNDCVDASGSVVRVEQLDLRGAGDKGLSAGERSLLEGREITIDGAAIGIASKDLSTIRLSMVQLEGGEIGVTAYRKKSEYGPGVVTLSGVAMRGQKRPFMIERLSSVVVDGQAMPADVENVADSLYGVEYGKSSR